ncbi:MULTISPECIES: Fe-S cluster assembly sulfur transfer protein SufU [unclassified Microbacterium]|uniref:Fe-S cluster assembly sulfur transfer protein SufU n=1 Tax=unclassified Microbacterium TaxID=2609290 RepID=UPI001AC0C563|nr:SUF system NifU family Fe-S cluster assembly protein [Microbacterium sp.]MBN9156805.1 SUF system NifU family Fe-S cluster assembly protein [Microbacterium sp.]MBS1898674.1 SUF system NifU family Fe-S cluster assembly protein [Actinomycetota bacterium]MBS1900337.1 SUF system NifU family Fe-S cluster assembly protein [Actinomycetota bacterium]
MSGLEDLYQELILDHSKRPHGKGLLEATDDAHEAESHQRNPICGDEITLRARISDEGDRIAAVSWDGAGCSISQASASMLTELVVGKTRAEATTLIDGFREALRSRGAVELDEDLYGDAAALTGVSRYVARVKCAMLAWVALEDALLRA